MSKRGKTLRSTVRQIIYNVIQFCQREKASKSPIIDLNKATERVAAMTGLSRDTVSKIKKEGAVNRGVWCTPGKKRKGRPKTIILDDFDKCAIRSKIQQFYTVRKEVPTLRKLHRIFNNITTAQWQKECEHVKHVEEKYWEQDHLMDNLQEFIINVTESESEDETDESDSECSKARSDISGIEYLDSDFDYGTD